MKVAFVGFEEFAAHKQVLQTLVKEYGYTVTKSANRADVLIIPHHLDDLFPDSKKWIAVWIQGSARIWDFSAMKNKPGEIIAAHNLEDIRVFQGESLRDTLDKISKS